MANAPKISVVIATYNRREALLRTLTALREQSLAPGQYEVIVVVDGSTDASAEATRGLISPCTLRVVEQANRGRAAARNTGARLAGGDLILFLDDDLVFDSTLVREHLGAHGALSNSVVFGPILLSPESRTSVFGDMEDEWRREHSESMKARPLLGSPDEVWFATNCSIPRTIFIAAGGFDESILGLEGKEFGLRLRRAGVPFRFHPGAIVYHHNSKTIRSVLRHDAAKFGRNEVLLCRRYPEFRRYADLALIGDGGILKRAVRQAGARMPVSPEPFLSLTLGLMTRLRRFGRMQRLGMRMMGLSAYTMASRAALAEAGSWSSLSAEFGMRLPVLMYHHVGILRPGGNPYLTISPARFAAHVEWLARRGYSTITPSDWTNWIEAGTPLPAKPILITFDDGFSDTAENAFPVLRRHGFSATAFLVTALIGESNEWDAKTGFASLPLMNAEQVKYWAGNGIEFGAHTRTHRDLTTLSGPEMEEEIAGSASDVEKLLGRKPLAFAYPYGLLNDAVAACAQRDFPISFSTMEGVNSMRTDLSQMRRLDMTQRDAAWRLAYLLKLGFHPVPRVRAKTRVRSRLRELAARAGFELRPRSVSTRA